MGKDDQDPSQTMLRMLCYSCGTAARHDSCLACGRTGQPQLLPGHFWDTAAAAHPNYIALNRRSVSQ